MYPAELAWLLLAARALAAEPATPDRFSVEGLRVQTHARAPRFAVAGLEAWPLPATAVQARFDLESGAASCGVDELFANGFEQAR